MSRSNLPSRRHDYFSLFTCGKPRLHGIFPRTPLCRVEVNLRAATAALLIRQSDCRSLSEESGALNSLIRTSMLADISVPQHPCGNTSAACRISYNTTIVASPEQAFSMISPDPRLNNVGVASYNIAWRTETSPGPAATFACCWDHSGQR